jgi:putative resolvase
MKLSVYARHIGITYKTAYRWWKAGRLDAYQLDTGTVIVRHPIPKSATGVALYARVSSVDQKRDLDRQMQRLKDYAAAHGYQVTRMVSEIGSRREFPPSQVFETAHRSKYRRDCSGAPGPLHALWFYLH